MNVAPRKEPRLWTIDPMVDGRYRVHRGPVEHLMADKHAAEQLRNTLNVYERDVCALQRALNKAS